jgi:hypothetical protein
VRRDLIVSSPSSKVLLFGIKLPETSVSSIRAVLAAAYATYVIVSYPKLRSQPTYRVIGKLSLNKSATHQGGPSYSDGIAAGCQSLPHRDGFGPILNFNVAPD